MKTAIVNDDRKALEVLCDLMGQVQGLDIIWTAGAGEKAIEKARANPPQLILMDLHMPGISGVQATRVIMQEHPCAILLVSSSVENSTSMIFEAMGQGALDVVSTPHYDANGALVGQEAFLKKVERIRRYIEKRDARPEMHSMLQETEGAASPVMPPLVAIGASTGGPKAMLTLLSSLPADYPAAIIIVQHVDSQFVQGLVEWLDRQCPLLVAHAEAGKMPSPSKVYVAHTDSHLIVDENRCFAYQAGDPQTVYQPSIDTCFQSLAFHWPKPGLGVILTGMGKDGAKGLLQLKEKGWKTIAQDQSTSIVYGMPRAAVKLDAAGQVLPLHEIAQIMRNYAGR